MGSALLLTLGSWCAAQDAPSAIPEPRVAALQRELDEASDARSTTRKRRAYKRVVRKGNALLAASPKAPNRWHVLEIVFRTQKRLLILENSRSSRDALMQTCGKLALAPDDLSVLRVEADLLLLEREMSSRSADIKERAAALAALVARYRDTPGEAKSLMLASQIAPKLEAFDLEKQILRAMQERFADHHGVIEFRRKSLAAGRIEALFRGTFPRADGASITFPIDRMGHPGLAVFWSKETSGFDVALKQINEHRKRHPERFDFYSFNLDGLPDSGESIVRGLGLDWTMMRLPGGRESQTFRTYARREPVGILVNAYGYTLLTPNNNYGRGHGGAADPYKIEDTRITDPRYLAQLQSLFVGDFLVRATEGPGAGRLAVVLKTIGDCFVAAPFRYRLARTEAMANYRKAARLGEEAVARFAEDPDLWRVHNRRIIALLGMWKMAGEPKHLDEAVAVSRASLSGPLPRGADVVPRFCLAKAALRSPDADAPSILSDLIESTGGAEAPGTALAAATILALDANSKELHAHYRGEFLRKHADDVALAPVVTFLRDRYHTLDLLKVKLTRGERRIRSRYGDLVWPRAHLINHGLEPMTRPLPDTLLRTLDGKALTLPRDNEGRLTLLLFVELPADPAAEIPLLIGGSPPVGRDKGRDGVMQFAFEMARRHVHQEVDVITAFLSDDVERVRSLMKKKAWPCRAVLVPGGLRNPMVRRLGILSADRIPNVFLLRRNGTIAWHTSGFLYKSDFGYPFAIRLAMKVHIEVCDTELAYAALAKRDYREAKRVFSGPFLPERDERYRWRGPRFHGRALANLGLKDWTAALADVDTAIEAHRKDFAHRDGGPSESLLSLHRVRASILAELGREEEAGAARRAAAATPVPYPVSLYETFHGRLEELRVSRIEDR